MLGKTKDAVANTSAVLSLGGVWLSLGVLFSSSALAELEETVEKNWEASAELGFLKTSGNSDNETLNAKLTGQKSLDNWLYSGALEAVNSSQEDERSAERYLASIQADYAIDARSYWLGALNWEKDRFSGYDYQASALLGYGYKVLDADNKTLSLELAPGYRISELNPRGTEKEAIVKASQKFAWSLSDSAKLDQSASVEYGDSNTLSRFNIALTSQVAGDLSMKVGYGLKHNSDVPEGSDKTDTETSVTLVYKL